MNVHGSTSIARAKGVFINNAWSDASSGQYPVIAPAEGRQFAEIAAGDAIDVDRAVKAARAAVEGAWGRLSATERGRLSPILVTQSPIMPTNGPTRKRATRASR
jgi:hypothetical protein